MSIHSMEYVGGVSNGKTSSSSVGLYIIAYMSTDTNQPMAVAFTETQGSMGGQSSSAKSNRVVLCQGANKVGGQRGAPVFNVMWDGQTIDSSSGFTTSPPSAYSEWNFSWDAYPVNLHPPNGGKYVKCGTVEKFTPMDMGRESACNLSYLVMLILLVIAVWVFIKYANASNM